MTYRTRIQRFTGKLVLQQMLDDWTDVPTDAMDAIGEFTLCAPGELRALHQRIAKYEKRAQAQRQRRAKETQ